MPTKSGAATFKDIKQGKTLWHVYAVFENDGSIRILSKEPDPYFITRKPYQFKDREDSITRTFWWTDRLVRNDYGEPYTTHFSLNDCHVKTPTENVSPFQTNRLFVSRRAAVRYIEMFKRAVPKKDHMEHLEWCERLDYMWRYNDKFFDTYSDEDETGSELDFANKDAYEAEQQG